MTPHSSDVFLEIARWYVGERSSPFSQSRIARITAESVSSYHPHARRVAVFFEDGSVADLIVKLHSVSEQADKHPRFALRERALAQLLSRFGFRTRCYLCIEPTGENRWQRPFSVAERIPGIPASELSSEALPGVLGTALRQLAVLHLGTVTGGFGVEASSLRSPRNESFGRFMSEYLVNDIERDELPFEARDRENLERHIGILDKARVFCLCHHDLTLSNIIVDAEEDAPILIDWTYARYGTPVYDLAYGLFWFIVKGFAGEAQRLLDDLRPKYEQAGFPVELHLPFCLAYKFIEAARFLGPRYLAAGKTILNLPSLEDLADVEF